MTKWLAALTLVVATAGFAQTVQPILDPHQTFVNAVGQACAGCSLYTYAAGTTTPQATYTDSTGTSQNTNPIILDATGSANIWGILSAYKFVLIDTSGTTLWTVDNIPMSPQINQVFYPTTFAEFQTDITACGSALCTIAVNTALGVTANTTVPSNVTVEFNAPGALNPSGGVTLVLNGPIEAPAAQIFGTSGTVTLGTLTTEDTPEWFGAVADWNGTTGTNNLAAIQASINALTSGCARLSGGVYALGGTLTVTKSSVGLCGVNRGYTGNGTGNESRLMETSAGVDVIDVSGTSQSSKIEWNRFTNFAIERSVVPTGTATGLSINHVGGVVIDGVHSEDSIRDFYLHDAPYYSSGLIANSVAEWGQVTGPGFPSGLTYPNGTLVYGWYIDSADGEAMNSQTLFNDNADTANLSNITSYALYESGSAINDFETDWFAASLTSYGIYVNCTATSNIGCQDNHFVNSIFDGQFISAIYINGISAAAIGSVDVRGGWINNYNSASPTIDIESSTGVSIENAQITGPNAIGIKANASGNLILNANTIFNVGNIGIWLVGTSNSSVTGNVIHNTASQSIASGIRIQATSGANVIAANTLTVDSGGSGTNGIDIDSSSNANSIGPNTIVGFTTALVDAGSNNSLLAGSGITIGAAGSHYHTRSGVAQSGTPLCSASGNATCTFAVTWVNAFPDALYAFNCYPLASTGAGIIYGGSSESTTGVTVTFKDLSGSTNAITSANCEAWE